MYRNDDPSTVSVAPAVPSGTGLTPGFFSNGNPAAGLQATVVPDWWLNQQQEEPLAILAAAEITPVKGTNNQVLTALQKLFASLFSPDFAGTPNTPTPAAGDSSPQIANTYWIRTRAFSRSFGPAVSSGFYSGYRIAPDGFIEQWVFIDKASLPAGTQIYTVPFPIVFPNVAISAQATSVNNTTSNNGVSVSGLTASWVTVALDGNYSVVVKAEGF